MDLLTFEEAIEETEGMKKYLLLGNGFSVAWKSDTFSYRSLREQATSLDSDIQKLFSDLDTVDFEEVINAYEHASKVCNSYGMDNSFRKCAEKIRDVLIETIAENHPDTPFAISDHEFDCCRLFLSNFF